MTPHARQSFHESKDARQTSNDREAQLFFQPCQLRRPMDGRPNGRSERKNCPMFVFSPNATPQVAIGRAGFPCTTVIGRTDDDTTLHAVTTAPRPIVTFGRMMAPGPMNVSSSIVIPCGPRKWAISIARTLIITLFPTEIRSGRDVSNST